MVVAGPGINMSKFQDQKQRISELTLEGAWDKGETCRSVEVPLTMQSSDDRSKVHWLSVDTQNPVEIFVSRKSHNEFIILENVLLSKILDELESHKGMNTLKKVEGVRNWL